MLNTSVIDNTEAFYALRNEWDELLLDSTSNTLFLTWEWMFTWWKHLADGRKLNIITVRQEGLLIGIAPLTQASPNLSRMMPFKYLEFIASGNVGSDYLNFILRRRHEEDALQAITRQISNQGSMVELTRIEGTSSFAKEVPTVIRRFGGRSRELITNTCPYIDIRDHTWDSYLSSLSKRHQKNIHKRIRKVEREFNVELLHVTKDSDLQEAMVEFLDIHTAHWQSRDTVTALSNPRIASFHREFSELALHNGWLRLFQLRLDGDTAAAVYQFMYNRTYFYFQSALNSTYTRHSPGMILLALSIQQAITEGAQCFDLLHDNEQYKYLWTNTDRDLVRIELYPATVQGALSRNVLKVKNMIPRKPTSAGFQPPC